MNALTLPKQVGDRALTVAFGLVEAGAMVLSGVVGTVRKAVDLGLA